MFPKWLKYSKAHRRQEMASAELALEAKNTLPSSFDSDRRGDFQRPGGLVHTPRSPVSNINRIRPASPLQTGLVQPWVQSEGSCLASATPFNVSVNTSSSVLAVSSVVNSAEFGINKIYRIFILQNCLE